MSGLIAEKHATKATGPRVRKKRGVCGTQDADKPLRDEAPMTPVLTRRLLSKCEGDTPPLASNLRAATWTERQCTANQRTDKASGLDIDCTTPGAEHPAQYPGDQPRAMEKRHVPRQSTTFCNLAASLTSPVSCWARIRYTQYPLTRSHASTDLAYRSTHPVSLTACVKPARNDTQVSQTTRMRPLYDACCNTHKARTQVTHSRSMEGNDTTLRPKLNSRCA